MKYIKKEKIIKILNCYIYFHTIEYKKYIINKIYKIYYKNY